MKGVELQSTRVQTGVWLDPRTKLFLTLIIMVVLIAAPSNGMLLIKISLAAIPFCLLLFGKKWNVATIYALVFSTALISEALIMPFLTGILGTVVLMFCGIIIRMMPGLIMGYYLVSTTTVSEFASSMERLHVPRTIIIPFSVMFRFFPTIREESKAINDAMRMRGIGLSNKNPADVLEYRLVPLMMSSVKIGDELSAASLTRGLDNPVKRTSLCKVGFGVADLFFMALATVCLILFILEKIQV